MTTKVFKTQLAKRGGTITAEGLHNTLCCWGMGFYGKRLTAVLDTVHLFFEYGKISTRHQGEFQEDHIKVYDPGTEECCVMMSPEDFFDWFDEGTRTWDEFMTQRQTERTRHYAAVKRAIWRT